MKEILLVGTGFSLIVICCALAPTGDSLVFLGVSGSTLATLAGVGAVASFLYFFLGK